MSGHVAAWRAALAELVGTDYPDRSAVFRAQCYTWALARRLSGLPAAAGSLAVSGDATLPPVYLFHALAPCPAVRFTHYRAWRTPATRTLRNEVAALVRAERALVRRIES